MIRLHENCRTPIVRLAPLANSLNIYEATNNNKPKEKKYTG